MGFENLFTKIQTTTSRALDHFLADHQALKKYEVVELALRSFLRDNGMSLDEDCGERKMQRKLSNFTTL